MQSCAWMNGQYLQFGPPSQSDTMRNQQAGTANNVCQYRTANTGVRPPQSAHLTFRDGAFNRQTSNGQTSAVLPQAVSTQQPDGGKNNGYYLKVPYGNLQNSSPNTQSGNPHSQVIYGLQVATQQDFHQTSAQNSSTQSPSDMMKANTTYTQQDVSANWNQSVTSARIQNENVVSDLQHCMVQRNLYQNVYGESTNPILAFTTTAPSLPPAQAVCNSTLMSATAHNIQTAPNQHHRQNSTQHGFRPSIPPPPYNVAFSQSYGNSSITTNWPSSGRSLHVSSMSQKTQQYSTQLNSTPNNGEAATSSINSNSYNCQYEVSRFLSKPNELPLNPAAGTQQQMLSSQMSTRFADSLCKSVTAGSDGCPPVSTSSPHNGTQFDSKDRMMKSNPTMVTVPSSAIERYNSNASQSLSLHSGQSLHKTTQNLVSATQHIVDELPQLMQQPEIISPQGNKTHSSVGKNIEILKILEMLTSINPNDSSIHSSPGRTGPRAIAVVQPLAQECYQVASKDTSSKTINQECEHTTTDESQSNPEKFFISPDVAKNKKAAHLREVKDDFRFPPKSPNQVRSNKSAIRHSAASNDGAVVSSSDSAGPQHSQKQLFADFTGSESAVNMQLDQIVAPVAQQSLTSEVPESQNGDKDKSEMPPDAKACVCELSSLPTNQWTVMPILKLLQEADKIQMNSQVFPEFNTARKLLSMYWDGSCKPLADKLRTGWYRDLITDVQEFCRKHVTLDTVILSQVKRSFAKQLKSFHVIADNEVYSELPYTSTWLNTNERLDDIDEEFGFPWSLKHHPHTLDSDSQPDQIETVNSIPAQIVSEVQNKALSQTELEPVDSEEEKHSTVEVTSTQTVSPHETESADSSDDPYYSFDIQVLPPEEAKVIFEQVKSKMAQSTERVCQPEKVTNSSVDELSEVIDVTISHSKLENGEVSPLEQICCIARWKQIILGSNMPSSSTCQCKKEQSPKDCSDKTLDEEEKAAQKNDKLIAIRPDSNVHSAMVGENQAKDGENIFDQILTFSWPELCNEVSQTIDLNDNDDKPYSYSDKDPNNIPLLSTNSSQSSITFTSENKDENLSTSGNETSNQMQVLEENCEQAYLKPTKSSQSTCSHSSEKVQRGESEVATQITTNLVEDSGQAQLISPDVAESPLKTEGQTQISVTAATQTFSLKHETVDPGLQQLLEGVSKCRKGFVDAADSEPLASNVRTVELVLFGSATQGRRILVGGHKSHRSSPQAVSDEVPRPPEVLSVSLSPLKRKPSETVPRGEYSVKRLIHEKWRKAFPPTRIKHRSKLKTQKCTLSEVSLKKAERNSPTNTEELPVFSEMRLWNRNTKHSLSLKRRRSLSCGLKLGVKKTKKDAVPLKQPAVHERSKSENGSQAGIPLQENNVLRFSVLPNTFSFKDASNGTKDTTDHVSDKAELVGANDKSRNITVKRARGAWYRNPEKQYIPLHRSPVRKTSSIFHEYQKKYTKMQPSVNE